MTSRALSRVVAPLAVLAGGALGALARLSAGLLAGPAGPLPSWDPALPVLLANVVGSWAIGVVAARSRRPPAWLTTGVLGGFTTFSGWVLDVARLWPERPVVAALLGIGTPVLAVAACSWGLRTAGLRS